MNLSSRTLLFLPLLLLAGCSSRHTPDFTASGYLADRGAVRIWRKAPSHTTHLQTVYTPFTGQGEETTDYYWQQDKLISIARHIAGKQQESVTLRFDRDGSLNFMQRQLAGRRESLSADAIALYQFDAGRMRAISDDLLKGRVTLLQGHWTPSGTVMLCHGGKTTPDFESNDARYITQHQQESGQPLSIAWLKAPGGTQLLLATPKDICPEEPQADSF
ncbi:DUF1481 domain-containing protein [Erwinia phyllosphaerae]|uniref:DUF1481 domain-containing protein n=1 Tax=Erwinia phyllosphaerae TaxID=2853256 RepID=UPI001FEE368A|nr:DUF1481 domain-containing protein [Erwinia phyllosphaerae]